MSKENKRKEAVMEGTLSRRDPGGYLGVFGRIMAILSIVTQSFKVVLVHQFELGEFNTSFVRC